MEGVSSNHIIVSLQMAQVLGAKTSQRSCDLRKRAQRKRLVTSRSAGKFPLRGTQIQCRAVLIEQLEQLNDVSESDFRALYLRSFHLSRHSNQHFKLRACRVRSVRSINFIIQVSEIFQISIQRNVVQLNGGEGFIITHTSDTAGESTEITI